MVIGRTLLTEHVKNVHRHVKIVKILLSNVFPVLMDIILNKVLLNASLVNQNALNVLEKSNVLNANLLIIWKFHNIGV